MRPRMFPLLSVHGSVCVADDVLDDQVAVSFWNFLKTEAESLLIFTGVWYLHNPNRIIQKLAT